MYNNLGIHWASSVPGFLALACIPFPFLFYKYGPAIRERCKFAAQAAEFMRSLQQRKDSGDETSQEINDDEQNANDYSYDDQEPRFEGIKTGNAGNGIEGDRRSVRSGRSSRANSLRLKQTRSYQHNPYDIDRTSAAEAFTSRSRASSFANKK